jgi:hypothetical protein
MIHNAEVDLNYAMYYPLMKPYSALYPRGKKDAEVDEEAGTASAKKTRGDPEMWKTVERAMEEGTLEDLRNSSVGTVKAKPKILPARERRKPNVERKKQALPDVAQNRREKRRAAQTQEDDQESDGGFFE